MRQTWRARRSAPMLAVPLALAGVVAGGCGDLLHRLERRPSGQPRFWRE
jgi:hypothetical protein